MWLRCAALVLVSEPLFDNRRSCLVSTGMSALTPPPPPTGSCAHCATIVAMTKQHRDDEATISGREAPTWVRLGLVVEAEAEEHRRRWCQLL